VSRKRLRHLINVGVGTGNSEGISIGAGEKIVGLGDVETKMLNSVGNKYAP